MAMARNPRCPDLQDLDPVVSSAVNEHGTLALPVYAPFIARAQGAEAFALMADHATLWEITQVHEDAQGEVFMALPGADWVEVAREEHAAAGSDPAYTFVTYRRAEEGAQPCA